MRRSVISCVLLFIFGLALGGAMMFLALAGGWLPSTWVAVTAGIGARSASTVAASEPVALSEAPAPAGNEALVGRALEVAGCIRDQNWAALAGTVHPDKGVTFTPYSSVSDSDLCFSPAEVAAFGGDSKVYLWGSYDGSGAPMSLTVEEYFAQFVGNTDYTRAPFLAVDRVISSGNAVENVADAYPDARFVELYYSGLDEAQEGFDWCALKLVFEPVNGALMLVGVIHSQWTI